MANAGYKFSERQLSLDAGHTGNSSYPIPGSDLAGVGACRLEFDIFTSNLLCVSAASMTPVLPVKQATPPKASPGQAPLHRSVACRL